ncbi:DUF5682 family protein [Nonomuraea sp. NPDC050328]|uniref:DUF5682 family protein n=1 Tax=Nonomuraea sp. NPDC050328 TaxID=3364361 RepID=UPI0037A6608E
MSLHVLGVRHHGPGSARAVRAELELLRPDAILIEGPPEANALIPLLPELEPPVALLAHVPGDPSRAAFWPFAAFSPEWQAMAYGVAAGAEVRFIDLPAATTLAMPSRDDQPPARPAPGVPGAGGDAVPGGSLGQGGDVATEGVPGAAGDAAPEGEALPGDGGPGRGLEEPGLADPLGWFAAAAGYDDPERWWEDVVEHRGDTPFQVIAEAMAAVREGHEPGEREARREAHMRRAVRAAMREGFETVVVVCGAWHAPAIWLDGAQADNALLRGLPKVKVELTWVPWTYGRLAAWSGYGAGITSPGWYHHLFTAPDRPVERWLAAAAGVLRQEGLAVSSAHVIEAVRLAHSLAGLRGRPLAGLGEVSEAALAVLCEGDALPLDLIQRQLVVGDRIGHVGDGVPMVPLQRDLREQQRRLRLPAEALVRELDLDLRKPLDLDRSRLLHRLRLLGVEWGTPREARGKGTFRESWSLSWDPEFDLRLIELAALGVTVESAAVRYACDLAGQTSPGVLGGGGRGAGLPAGSVPTSGLPGSAGSAGGLPGSAGPGGGVPGSVGPGGGSQAGSGGGVQAGSLADLAGLVERCLLADLPAAMPAVLAALSARAALDTDVTHLMAALPAMVRAQRYGDVRGTSAEGLAVIASSLLDRICVGLPVAVTSLDDDSAAALLKEVDGVHSAVALLEESRTDQHPVPAQQHPVGQPPGIDQPASVQPRPESVAGPPAGAEAEPQAGVDAGLLGELQPPASPSAHPADQPPTEAPPSAGVPAHPDDAAQAAEAADRTAAEAPRMAEAESGVPRERRSGGGASPESRWLVTLRGVCDRRDLHGLIEGRLTRILLDAGEIDDAESRMARAMSRGNEPARAAAWVEGFLAGGGLLLVHDPTLLPLLDRWLAGLGPEEFVQVLPLLRRTFGKFATPERRSIGQRVKGERKEQAAHEVDERRAAPAVRTVLDILGRSDG